MVIEYFVIFYFGRVSSGFWVEYVGYFFRRMELAAFRVMILVIVR